MYHGAPRDSIRGIFHVPDVPDDLFAYDESECHTLISAQAGIDGMTPGFAELFASRSRRRCSSPSASSTCRSTRPRGARISQFQDITTVVVPRMAHMHNFAETRANSCGTASSAGSRSPACASRRRKRR